MTMSQETTMRDSTHEYIEAIEYALGFKFQSGEYYNFLLWLERVPFTAKIDMDENRGSDGIMVRRSLGYYDDPSGPSLLEVLVGLAQRMEYIMSGTTEARTAGEWFTIIVENWLGMPIPKNNKMAQLDFQNFMDDKAEILLNREYESNGKGGLFPLVCDTFDSREEELWVQMQAYLRENYTI